MYAMFVLVGASLLVAVGFLIAFFWAVRNGQYEDTYTPSVRVLFDDKTNNKHDDSNKAKDVVEK